MAMSARELFDDRIPASLTKDPLRAKEIGAVFLFTVSGEGGGQWTIDLASSAPSCKPGNPDHLRPACTIEVPCEDFGRLVEKPARAMELYFQGKMKIGGDTLLATKLQRLLSLGR